MADFNLGTARGKIEIDGSGAATGVGQANAAVGDMDKKMGAASGSLMKVGGAMSLVGVAAVAGFGMAVNSAANFEERVSAIGAVSNATGAQMDAIRKQAMQLGADTKFSAIEAAQAMENLVKGGLSVEQTLGGAAKSVTDLAAATDSSLDTSSELVATAVSAFKLQADQVPHIADVVTGAVNSYVRSGDEFRLALSQSAAVAKTVGLSFDDLALGINAMASAGIHGSDAGTSLKTMMLNLQPTTKTQVALFKELGLITDEGANKLQALGGKTLDQAGLYHRLREAGAGVHSSLKQAGVVLDNNAIQFRNAKGEILPFNDAMAKLIGSGKLSASELQSMGLEVSKGGNQFFDATGKVKSMADISGVLKEALKGMTEQQKLATLETLFGTDAIRAGAVMADLGAEGLNKLNGEMGKTTAAETAAKRMDNLKGSIEQFKGSVETAMIRIGQLGQGPVRAVVDFLTGLVNGFMKLPAPVQQFIIMATMALALIIGMGGAFILLGGGILKAIQVFQGLQTAIQTLKSLEIMTKLAAAAQAAWNAIMLMNPMFLVIAAIVLLVAAIGIILLKTGALGAAWDWIKGVASDVWGAIVAAFNWVKKNWDILLAVLLPGVGLIIMIWKRFGDTIKEVVGNVIGWFTELPGKILGVLKGAGSWLIDTGKDIINGLINGIKGMAGRIVGVVKDVIMAPLNGVKGLLGIGSPSKVFMGYGRAVVEGMQIGLDSLKTLEMPPITQEAFKLAAPGLRVAGGDGAMAGSTMAPGSGGGMNVTINAPLVEASFEFGAGSTADDIRRAWNEDIKTELADTLESVLTGVISGAGSK